MADLETPKFFSTKEMPCQEWEKLWEDIVIESQWRHRLENYADLFIDKMLKNQHKLVVFDGPPGTGKSTLAKGYANLIAKLSKGSSLCYQVNAESWRSRWVGEPAQFVAKAFDAIGVASRKYDYVMVIIDELEAVAISRGRTLNVNEPSDIITAVSILLNRLDELKPLSNVIVITTTNIDEAIDAAILNRADLLVPFGLPGYEARKLILHQLFSINPKMTEKLHLSKDNIEQLAEMSEGLNGRDLNRLLLRAFVERPKGTKFPSFNDFRSAIDDMKSHQKI